MLSAFAPNPVTHPVIPQSADSVHVLCPVRCEVGESPVWSVAEQALYWVDIEGRRIHRFDAASATHASWATAERVGCIALHAQGGLLAAMETGIFHMRLGREASVAATLLHAMEFPRPGMRFNDGRTDRAGRFWVTSMVRDMALGEASGALFRLDGHGLSKPLVTGLVTGNGLGFSADGRTMYLSDSHPSVQRVWVYDLDAQGNPQRRRYFVDMNQHPGRPDGAAVDAEGCYWTCGNDAGLVHRFTPDGKLERSLRVPAAKPAMCAFGGPALDQLFVTSIAPAQPAPGYDPALAGAVFVLRPGVRGLAETPFQP
jgi:sugar lactone lactonase YvrE